MIEAMSCPLFRFVVHASAAGTGGDSALSLMAGYEHPSDQVGKRENVSVSVEVLVAERALGAQLRQRLDGLAPLSSASPSSDAA